MARRRFVLWVAAALAGGVWADGRVGESGTWAGPAGAAGARRSAQPAIPAACRQQLARRGIEPTAAGIRQYLASWVPGNVDPDRIARLIEQLSDDRYQTRERATLDLMSAWPGSKQAVLKAMASRDPEVRIRAARVRSASSTRPASLALAVRVVEHAQFEGMVPPLLDVLPHWPDDSARRRIWSAIAALARPGDAETFVKALGSDSDAVRIAAAVGLLRLGRREALARLAPAAANAADPVRLAMARLTCFAGRRESVSALCRLLKSPDAEVRSAAALTLYDLTDKPMPFLAYDQAASAPQADRWAQWLASSPPHLPPRFPHPSSHWPRNVALDKAVTSAVAESPKYCLSLGLQASRLTDGLLTTASAPGSLHIDYTIDLRRTVDGLDLSPRLPRGYRISRIVVHWKHFGGTRPNKKGGVFHYAKWYELMHQPAGSTQWQRIHRCPVTPEKEPENLSRRPLILKYVADRRQTMIAGLDLRHVAKLRLTSNGHNWMGVFELEAFGVPDAARPLPRWPKGTSSDEK